MRKLKDKGIIWTLSPIVFWLLAFLTIPLIIVMVMGFLTRGVYGQVEYNFNTENYTKLLNPVYIKILINSLKISFLATITCLITGYPFAYFITKAPKRYRSLLFMLIIIPFWTNSLIRTYAWIVLLRTTGIINSYLLKLGLISAPIQMLYTDGAVLLGLVYTLFPFMVLPLYASIDSVDKSYIEAATDLGATPWRTFWKITIPLTMPGIIAGCILVFIPTLGLFFIPDLMGGSKVMLISNLIKNQFLTARDWPFGSAISIVIIVITFILIGLYVKLSGGSKKTEVI
ncbi:spermidine/putrescine ABC transporter permease [Clostridium polyendosporum]|uniref:Spermidine/putrescine ABC transporter permease n=1 Tax=Clostridium polyendosporum TaxID=69208 RepID=A0A919VFY4_9CLOT|nr:ABC transporter permease [Clostridium polyendosporum]GIM28006.1 spermidine/putrescine ABC transporter permease [Clostridium polyendosporum]